MHAIVCLFSSGLLLAIALDDTRLHPAILYCWMVRNDFRSQLASFAGQTDMVPYVSLRDQREVSMPAFPESESQVAEAIQPMFDRQALAQRESQNLAQLRDTCCLC